VAGTNTTSTTGGSRLNSGRSSVSSAKQLYLSKARYVPGQWHQCLLAHLFIYLFYLFILFIYVCMYIFICYSFIYSFIYLIYLII